MASTVLPNGIIIPEKYSRDWYNDLYHNWQELDNLLGGGTPKDGTLTIQKNGDTVGTFSANQATDETINITVSDVNDGTLTIQQNGTTVDTFTANSSSDKTVNITVPTKTSDLTNDSGFLTSHQDLSDYIPRSGGAVMTGDTLGRIDNNNNFVLCGGTDFSGGASVVVNGSSRSIEAGVILMHPKNSTQSSDMWLWPDGTWTWTGTAVQLISDQRYKQQISEIDDALLDAWGDVELVQFKYNESVDTKGKSARLHTGYVVQQIDSACKSHGVDITQYGLFCHEEYPKEIKEIEVVQKDGTKSKERKVIREASEHYSLRYTEALIVECKYLRRCIARLTARIEELEKGNNIK